MACPQMKPSMLSILLTFVFCICGRFVSGEYAKFEKLVLPKGVSGPQAITIGGVAAPGPYATVDDGTIVRWEGDSTPAGFLNFAVSAPPW